MLPQWLIEQKRDGAELEPGALRDFVAGFAAGRIPDYQMAALAMAIYFQGMTPAETAALTRAMLESGERLDLSSLARPRLDKHSTGGIGDKVSLLLAPLAAACGLAVPMISGRGLGLTGGTLDKMESIPGYRANLTVPEFRHVVETCGCSIMGQTPRLCPADRKLYALRDVTGTVPSIPLITASIMSKKLAESLTGLVLDVKCGSGAFMRDRDQARRLGQSLMAVGREMGLPVSAWITRMDEPLGRAAGNRPEVAEVVRAFRGDGPRDLLDVTFALAARMLRLAGLAASDEDARPRLEDALRSGRAFDIFRRMVSLHGGDPAFLDDPAAIEARAACAETLRSPRAGWIAAVDAESIGRAALLLGAGRTKTDESVDPDAGLAGLLKTGEPVEKGQPLATLHTSRPDRLAAARPWVEKAYAFSDTAVAEPPVLLEDLGDTRP